MCTVHINPGHRHKFLTLPYRNIISQRCCTARARDIYGERGEGRGEGLPLSHEGHGADKLVRHTLVPLFLGFLGDLS